MNGAGPQSANAATAADVALAVVYGGVIVFFLYRWFAHKKAASFGIALMSAGWIILALSDLGYVSRHPTGWLRWIGAAVGVYLLTSVFRAEFGGQGDTPKG